MEQPITYDLVSSANQKKPGVYFIFCRVNGLLYLGSTKSPRKRFGEHFNSLKKNKHHSRHLQNTYNKYGINAFSWAIIENTTPDRLLSLEQEYLDIFKPFDRKYGFNTCSEAKSPLGIKHTDQTKQRVKDALRNCRNQRIERSVELYGTSFDVRSPDGTIYHSKGVYKFARDNNLIETCFLRVVNGTAVSHRGWRLAGNPIEKYSFLDPRGDLIDVPKGKLRGFCTNNNLNYSCMMNVVSGEYTHHKGWCLPGNANIYIELCSPNRDVIKVSRHCLVQFAKDHGLVYNNLLDLVNGKILYLKRWVLKQNSHKYHDYYKIIDPDGNLVHIDKGEVKDYARKQKIDDPKKFAELAICARKEFAGYKCYFPNRSSFLEYKNRKDNGLISEVQPIAA